MTAFTVLGGPEFAAFTRRLQRAGNGREIRQWMTRKLREVGRPVVIDIQAAVRAIQVRGTAGRGSQRRAGFQKARGLRGGSGLRATVARGAKLSIRLTGKDVGMRVYMDNSHMPRSQRNLPAHLNNPRGWRHPVFRRRTKGGQVVNVWVRQVGEPYFDRVIQRHRNRVLAAAKEAVDEAIQEIL